MKYVSKILLVVIMSSMLMFSLCSVAYGRSSDAQMGEVIKVSGDIYVNEGTSVNGNVVTVSGNIYINGSVTGDAVAVFGDIIVNGKVLGDAVSVTGKITVGQDGKVLGDTVEALGGAFSTNRSYNYNYNYNYHPRVNAFSWWSTTASIFFSFLVTLVLFGLASLVYVIMPKKIEEMADTIEPNFGKRIGIGFLTLIGSPIAMIIVSIVLAITIIGIIVIPFAWIAYMLAAMIALVPVYVYIGKKTGEIVVKRKMTGYGALAVGILVIWIINTIASFGGLFTGWITWLISTIIFVLGAGTVIDYIFTNRKRKPANVQYPQYPQYPPYPPQGGGYGENPQNPYYQGQNNNVEKNNDVDNRDENK